MKNVSETFIYILEIEKILKVTYGIIGDEKGKMKFVKYSM